MSFEIFEALEKKVQQSIDVISSLQTEVGILREKNKSIAGSSESLKTENEQLQKQVQLLTEQFSTVGDENKRLKDELRAWKERLQQLLSKINDIANV